MSSTTILRKTRMMGISRVVLLTALFAAGHAVAADSDAKTAIGGGIGAVAGTAIGQAVGGNTGGIIGGAVGGGTGAAVTTKGSGKTGAVVGAAVGGGAGAAVGQSMGGKTGGLIGAGVGGAAGSVVGKSVSENNVKTQAVVYEGGDRRHYEKKHGKGHAYGHHKHDDDYDH
jgi:hypothetical protein